MSETAQNQKWSHSFEAELNILGWTKNDTFPDYFFYFANIF